jgi:hypothetical protein
VQISFEGKEALEAKVEGLRAKGKEVEILATYTTQRTPNRPIYDRARVRINGTVRRWWRFHGVPNTGMTWRYA